MSKLMKWCTGLTGILILLVQIHTVNAESPKYMTANDMGAISRVDFSHNQITIGDMTYVLDNGVTVTTTSGKRGKLSLLRSGQMVSIEFMIGGNLPMPVIKKIHLLRR